MAKQKQQSAKKQTKRHSKKSVIIIGVIVLLIGAGAGVLFGTEIGREWRDRVFSAEETTEREYARNELSVEAGQLADDGDAAGAISRYEEAVDATHSDAEKSRRYQELAIILFDNGDVSDERKNQAFSYALRAEEIYPSSESAAVLARLHRDMGNQAESDEYMILVIERGEFDDEE